MVDIKALLAFYGRGFWRRKWTILALAWAVCVVGWIGVAALPDKYTVKSKVQVDTDRLLPPTPLIREMTGQVDPDLQRTSQMASVRNELVSKEAMQDVVHSAQLLGPGATEVEEQVAAADLANRVHVLVVDQDVLDISYEDKEPRRAMRVVESVVGALVDRNVAAIRGQTEQALKFIDTQIDDYERRLRDAEGRLADFERQNGNSLSTSRDYTNRLQELTTEQQQLDAEQKAKTWQRDRIKDELQHTPEWLTEQQTSTGTATGQLQTHLEELRQQYAELSQRATDKHPDVVALKAQIQEAEKRSAQAPSTAQYSAGTTIRKSPNSNYQALHQELINVEGELIAAQQRAESVNQSIATLRESSARLPDIEARTAQLNRDYDLVRASYSKLIERRETFAIALNMSKEKTAAAFRMVETPKMPVVPSGPDRALLSIAVGLGSLAFGFAYAAARMLLVDASPGTVEELRALVGRPVLGVLSIVRQRRPLRTAAQYSAFVTASLAFVVVLGGLVYAYKHTLPGSASATIRQQALESVQRVF
jgi:polysaccharide chain length determinant protein (PEP-CTERM system associated)